jgi:hypothetical protein
MSRLFACALFFVVTGCSIHPLPEDVTGVRTIHIVQKIRCETRDAAIEALVKFLEDVGKDHPGQAGVPLARDLAQKYRANPNAIREFGPAFFKAPEYVNIRDFIEVFYQIGVAYNFELTMTEDNNLSAGSANFQRTAGNSLFKLGVGGSFARKRSNDRTFTITDTFSNLLTTVNTVVRDDGLRDCEGYGKEENHVYPIVGRIGMSKVVYDFLDLTVFENLSGPKDNTSKPPTMADKLTFTTTLDASVTPKIIFTPTGTAFQLTDAAVTAGFTRTDVHEVTVGLALATNATAYLSSLRSSIFTPGRAVVVERQSVRPGRRKSVLETVVLGARVSGGGTPAEALAVYAVDQLKSKQFQLTPAP